MSEFEKIDSTYIADGHHRSAAAFNTGVLRRQRAIDAGIEVTGDETFNFFLTVIFPDTQCKILDYNRLLNTLNDMDEDEFIDRLSESYVITDKDEANPRPEGPGHVSMYIKDKWFDLAIKPEKLTGDPSKDIDYQLLTDYCFKEIMGIENIKKDGRVEFVGGGRGINYLVTRCHKDCKAAFLMPPATMEQIFAVADAGQTMPPKCTWFEPKLRSGFVVNFFDDPTAKK